MAISNASNQIVKVNLVPGVIPSVLYLSQYDTGAGRPITFSIYDGSQAFTIPSGVSIRFEGTKPDGNGFSFTCSKSGGNALLTNYTNQMTALPGKIMCQLVFTNTSGGRVGSLPVLMVVTPAGINGDTVISDSDIEAIIAAQNQYAVLNAKLDTAISAATQDSEVQDIRVKANGTSAATAGNAVREQITELKNDLHNVAVATYKIQVTKGAASNTSGQLVPFVAKNGDSITAYTVDGTTFGEVQLRFYDASRAYIKHWTLAAGYGKTRTFTFDQSTEAYYVGVTTVNTDSPDDYYVVNNNNIYKSVTDGLQSQIDENHTEIGLLNEQAAIKNIINRFNPDTISASKYINITNGALANNADFFASDFIYIGDLDRVTVSYTHLFCWYDANKSYVSPNPSPINSRARDLTFDVPENVAYLRFSTYNADLSLAQIGKSVNRANYVPYGKYALPDLVIDVSNDIVVDASGSGDYTSLTEALFDNVDNGIDIVVKPGTYDIAAEYIAKFGQTAVDNMQDSDAEIFNGFQFGAIIRNRKITFETGSHVVCDWTGHTVDNTHRFSPIRVDYNAEVIGLHLTAIHTFYAIHDDYGPVTPYTVKYENCHIIGSNLVNVNCIGGGCKKYSRHIIKNCYFDNGMNGSTTVRYHNTNVAGSEPEIYVSDSYFNGAFTPRWYGSQTTKMRVYVNNCEARSIHKMAESSSATVDNVELYKWCNIESNPES